MKNYIQQSKTREAYQPPGHVVGVLRQIVEPERKIGNIHSDCPCLCVPYTRWASDALLYGGAAIVKLGC